ncbi:hypothetical protein [Akkermansia sp.]|uniref:hypothetical protein n=1 Tax=Akkermansia sp. TaxID=1872421 RepID=UPI0025BB83EB|nr:hypothetical protein [Akkermansia sp.]MCC8147420.1 hypothetical protein [Akkermansia sp.]
MPDSSIPEQETEETHPSELDENHCHYTVKEEERMSSCDGFTPFQQSSISPAISRRFSPAKWNSVCPWKGKAFREGVKKKFFHPCHFKKT